MSFSPRETPRLILRPINIGDWRAIHRYMSDRAVTAWLPEGLMNEDQSRAFATKSAGAKPEALAVLTKDSNELIGHMVFHPWFAPQTYEIGWVFAREHQRRGYATEAGRSLLAYAFESLGCHRVIATCQPQNVASWRVMEKLGMRREWHFRKCIFRGRGEWWDEYFYAILDDEYSRPRVNNTHSSAQHGRESISSPSTTMLLPPPNPCSGTCRRCRCETIRERTARGARSRRDPIP